MTVVAVANVVGQARGEPIRLVSRRRRLSTIIARHKPAGRRFIVSVHRNAVDPVKIQPSDATVRLRKSWVHTLVGPRDIVLITILPAGGGGRSGGGKSFLGIGLAIASIALIALAPYAAPALAGSLLGLPGAAAGGLTTAIQAGMVVGGLALGYAAQLAANKSDKQRTLYSVAGGGNVPKPSSRKPLIYGKCWTTPPLSQRDFFRYDGDTMVLTKRMTLGLGKFQIHQIKVGDAVFWDEAQGIVAPFNQAAPGSDPASQTAIEFLYEQASTIAVGDAIASGDVAGQEIPRTGGNPNVSPWFRATPQGVVSNAVLISRTYPAIFETGVNSGAQRKTYAGAVWMARRIDPNTGAVIGQPFQLLREQIGPVIATTPTRRSSVINWPAEGAYEVNAQNIYADPGQSGQNSVTWDEMTAIKADPRIRPVTTEIAMRVRAGPGLTVTAFSDIRVLATRILPVWNGSAFVEQPTRKAVWAVCDLVRNQYGLAAPDGFDVAKAFYDAGRLTVNDTFDGQLPEVSSFWEAAAQILLPLRADPVKVGAIHSYVRDEATAKPRQVLTRRQIVRDSGSASYKLTGDGGDVIVEFDRGGDPSQPDEVRYSYGAPTRTPKRYKVPGISEAAHALEHAMWLALVSVFRGASRTITTEWDGRLIYPGDRILSDLWYLKGKTVVGVEAANDNLLLLDCDANLSSDWTHGSIRTRSGREWGILQMRGQGARGLELDAGDVAALSAATGKGLADVLANDNQDATTIVIGELVELQETYVARSAIPSDADHVRIELLADDPRIWQIMGEPVSIPQPISSDPLAEPIYPKISVLYAACRRIETGIELVWSVSPARGARSYAVWLSYDGGASREPVSNGAATSGRAPMRQCTTPVTVFAVAYGGTGLPGAEVSTTFTTVAPAIDGSLIDVTTLPPLSYDNLDDDLKAQVDRLDAIQAQVEAASEAVNQRLDGIRKALAFDPAKRQGYIDPIIGDLRGDLSILLTAADRNQQALADLLGALTTAGLEIIPSEGRARFYAIEQLQTAVGTQVTNLALTVDAVKKQVELYGSVQTGDLSGLISQITTVTQTLNALQGTISTLATTAQFTQASTRLTSAEQRLDAQAASIATKAEQATVSAQGVQINQVRQSLDAALGTIASAVIATNSASIDQALIPKTIDGLMALFGDQLGGLFQSLARAESSISANFDEAGRATAQVATNLLVFQGDASAQFSTVTKAVADVTSALVVTQTLYLARFGAIEASVASETLVRAAADSAQTTRTDGALSRIGTAESSITSLASTVATNQSAATQQFSSISTQFGTVTQSITSLTNSTSAADQALGSRIDTITTRLGNAEAATASETQARIDAYGTLSSRLDTVSARAENANSLVASETQARVSGDQANASAIQTVAAQTAAGTAGGRVGFSAVSAPSGVSARYSIQVSTQAGGQLSNAGLFIDIMPNGVSRIVMDANYFLLTANGGLTYPFQFDGQTLTIPSLRVTQSLIAPGAVGDPLTPAVSNVDPGVGSTAWREVPGTAVEFTPDATWTAIFSGAATVSATVQGNSSVFNNVGLTIVLGLDGVPISGTSNVTGVSLGAGQGVSGNNASDTKDGRSAAQLIVFAPNIKRRLALLYNFNGSSSYTGLINFAQLSVLLQKR